MKTIKVYTPAELQEKNPEGFERALEWYRDSINDVPWMDEIMDSLKAIFKASDLRLRDWSIDGTYPGSSTVQFEMDSDVADLSGLRAMAWLENNLLGSLRLPDSYRERWHKSDCVREAGLDLPYYRTGKAGEIKSCPFTGVCFDDDFLDALIKAVKDGDTLQEAYQGLAFVAGKLMESEIEYEMSEEAFLEQDMEFTKDGYLVR